MGENPYPSIVLIATVGLAAFLACSDRAAKLSDEELAMSAQIDFPETVLAEIKIAGTNLRRLSTIDEQGDQILAEGVTVDVSEGQPLKTVRDLRDRLGSGYMVGTTTSARPP